MKSDSNSLSVPEGFELGFVKSDDEVDELIKFNTTIHNELIASYLERRLEQLPDFTRELNYYIRNLDTGEIVSSLSAVPNTWEYDGIPLRNLELDCVGTSEQFRKRGFIRLLYSKFQEELNRGEYHISSLQGIPEFFRQFGYDFIFPLPQFSHVALRVDQIPRIMADDTPSFMPLNIRDADIPDLDEIIRLFDELGARLLVRSGRSRGLWIIQEQFRKWRAFDFQTKIVEREGEIDGYFRYVTHGDDSPMSQVWGTSSIDVIESSITSYDGVMRVLHYLKEIAIKDGIPLIFLPITSASNLSRICIDLGGTVDTAWKYQIRVHDMELLLRDIVPALERHLKGTMFSNLTRELTINTYHNCYSLVFEDGKLNLVRDLGIKPWGDLSIRYHDLVRLIFGESDLLELRRMHADIMFSGDIKAFIDTLFPKGESHIHYCYC